MNNFQHHIEQLEALGFSLERGMLVGAGRFADPNQIGTRFATAQQQIDTYTQDAFFDADKAHPKLSGETTIDGPQGKYTVTVILR